MTCRGRGCWGGGESVCFRDRIHGYSSAVTMSVELLLGESVVRKYWVRSVWGVVGGQDDVAMFVRM